MEAFRYQALDTAGRSVSGVVQADTAREARTQLRARGLLPSAVEKNVRQLWARGISAGQLSLPNDKIVVRVKEVVALPERALPFALWHLDCEARSDHGSG